MIKIYKAPDRNTNSENREFLCNILPPNIRVNGFPVGKWEFELQKVEAGSFPIIGTVSTDLKRITVSLEDGKLLPEWVIDLAQKIVERNKIDVDIFLQ